MQEDFSLKPTFEIELLSYSLNFSIFIANL
jgi:hypothetical protein